MKISKWVCQNSEQHRCPNFAPEKTIVFASQWHYAKNKKVKNKKATSREKNFFQGRT